MKWVKKGVSGMVDSEVQEDGGVGGIGQTNMAVT
jgi:hypothetical protein